MYAYITRSLRSLVSKRCLDVHFCAFIKTSYKLCILVNQCHQCLMFGPSILRSKWWWNKKPFEIFTSVSLYKYWNPRHPWKIPRTRKTKVWKRIFLLKGLFFRLHVDFQGWGCNGLHFPKTFSRSQPFRDVSVALEKWKRFVSCHKFLGVYNSPWSEWVYMGAWPSGCS